MITAAVSAAVPTQASSVTASVAPIASRGSAAVNSSNVRIENDPINSNTGGGGNGSFPNNPPQEAANPVVIYNTPPVE